MPRIEQIRGIPDRTRRSLTRSPTHVERHILGRRDIRTATRPNQQRYPKIQDPHERVPHPRHGLRTRPRLHARLAELSHLHVLLPPRLHLPPRHDRTSDRDHGRRSNRQSRLSRPIRVGSNAPVSVSHIGQVPRGHLQEPAVVHGNRLGLHGLDARQGHGLREGEAHERVHARDGTHARRSQARLAAHLVHAHTRH